MAENNGQPLTKTRGTLKTTEWHPSARPAGAAIMELPLPVLVIQLEAFSSCAIEGNRLAEICSETLDRLLKSEPVSDRYLLGLAWAMRSVIDDYHAGKLREKPEGFKDPADSGSEASGQEVESGP